MSYPGQVFEDPEYYDDAALELSDEDLEELEDPTNFIAVLERFNPFNTVNS